MAFGVGLERFIDIDWVCMAENERMVTLACDSAARSLGNSSSLSLRWRFTACLQVSNDRSWLLSCAVPSYEVSNVRFFSLFSAVC